MVINNVGTNQLISSINKDIEHLLYNPLTKNFYLLIQIMNTKKIINLKLTGKSNLDYSLYLKRANYYFFEPEFKKINNKKELIS